MTCALWITSCQFQKRSRILSTFFSGNISVNMNESVNNKQFRERIYFLLPPLLLHTSLPPLTFSILLFCTQGQTNFWVVCRTSRSMCHQYHASLVCWSHFYTDLLCFGTLTKGSFNRDFFVARGCLNAREPATMTRPNRTEWYIERYWIYNIYRYHIPLPWQSSGQWFWDCLTSVRSSRICQPKTTKN